MPVPVAPTPSRDGSHRTRPPDGVLGWPTPQSTRRFDQRATYTAPLEAFGLQAVAQGWIKGVYHPATHSVIYPPFNATQVIAYDIANDRWSVVATAGGTNGHSNAVLGPDGMVYASPFSANHFLRIDPVSKRVTQVPVPSTITTGANFWNGAAIYRGVIFCCPTAGTNFNILKFDTYTGRMETIVSPVTNLRGGTLAPNGMIYFAPASTSTGTVTLRLDPESLKVKQITHTALDMHEWVVARNGKLYSAPVTGTAAAVLDPVTEQVATFGSWTSVSVQWHGGFLGPDGLIYGVPYTGEKTLVIDPVKQTATMRATSSFIAPEYQFGTQLPDGRVIAMSRSKGHAIIYGGERPTPMPRTALTRGASGQFVSTPDTAAHRINNDITLMADVRVADWTPPGQQAIVGKWRNGIAPGNCHYLLVVETTGALGLYLVNGAGAVGGGVSTSLMPNDPWRRWRVGVTWRLSDGRIQFWTALPGSSVWTQLGTDRTSAIGSLNTTAIGTLKFGAFSSGDNDSGGFSYTPVEFHSSQVYNGLYDFTTDTAGGATLVADMNPTDYRSGTTWVGRDGLTYTVNGTALLTPEYG